MENNKEEKTNFIIFFKENITLILLGLYSLSFVNYYVYYKSFDISIFNYIGLNDMLFFSLEYIFKIIAFIFLSEAVLYITYTWIFIIYEKLVIFIFRRKGLFYIKSSKENKERIGKIFHKKFRKTILGFKFLVLIVAIFASISLPNKLVIYPILMICLVYYLNKLTENGMSEFLFVMSIGIIIISTLVTTLVNSYNKRFEKDDYVVSFNENSNHISTDKNVSCYNYLGETSSHIFLYDIEKKESKIYFKESVSELIIKNQNDIDKYILMIKESFIFQVADETYNRKQ